MSLEKVVMFSASLFYGVVTALQIVWRIITGPRTAFYVKNRSVPPKCLQDPDLGTHHYIQLKNVKLHYVAKGDEGKPLMLMVHGFPEFWYSWRYQLKEFSKDYRVVAVDQRGYNESEKPVGIENYAAKNMVEDLKQLIHALGYKSCVLVGHDWGGAICWGFADLNKNMVDKLIVMNCPHVDAFRKYLLTHKEQFFKSWYMFLFQWPWLPELYLRMNDYCFMDMVFRSKAMGVQSGIMTQDDVEAYKYAFSKPGAATATVNYYRAAFGAAKRDADPIQPPAKLIWGCKDGALEKGAAELSKDFCKNLSISYIPEASHWVQMDQPEKVNKYMWEFLKESPKL